VRSISGAIVILAGSVLAGAGLVGEAINNTSGGRVPLSNFGLAVIAGGLLVFLGFIVFVAGFWENRPPNFWRNRHPEDWSP
jgi:hypothetical protein